MTFDEILEHVLTLLQRQGRVSYRALQHQFDLDDEYLEDLKEEIIYAYRLAADAEGRDLVWTGPQQHRLAEDPQPTALHTPDAERRQLTVMVCDVVGSTRLASQLDPEDWRDILQAYQEVCREAVARFDGYVAQYLGDGLLAYFGYPYAHEDGAQRSVRAGLRIIAELQQLNTRLARERTTRLAVRVGIHTGLVVVGAIGAGARQEPLALGDVPTIATSLQAHAAPNTVVISPATYHLVQGYFTCQERRDSGLTGGSQPMTLYHVHGESAVQSAFDVARRNDLTPLVGRAAEIASLLAHWEHVRAGGSQVVLLQGEAGIGKSRLVQALQDHVADTSPTVFECRCSPYFQNTALYPLRAMWERRVRWHRDDTWEEKLEKLERTLSRSGLSLPEIVPLFTSLMEFSVPEGRFPPLNLAPHQQRQRTLEVVLAIFRDLASQQPVLLIMEDLHWVDPSTLQLLQLLIKQEPIASMCLVMTCRPTFRAPWEPHADVTHLTLNRLSSQQVAQMVDHVTGGKHLPDDVLQQIVAKTEGVPLFVEEFTKTVLASELFTKGTEHYELTGTLSTSVIPATLHDSLMARLDRLLTAKGVAQLGATYGRQFPFAHLQAILQLDTPTLQRELGQLVEAELLYQRGVPPHAMYFFKHVLLQEAAYQSLLKSTRQSYHQRIAQVLETQFPEMGETRPEFLAHHYTEAAHSAKALVYWQQAGRHALERSAHMEAIAHFTTGLKVLATLPETPERDQHELALHTALGPAFMATRGDGAPEVEQTYTRARELCQKIGDTSQFFPVLWGLCVCYGMRGEHRQAQELGEQLLHFARHQHDTAFLLEAHHTLWVAQFQLGELSAARAHAERGIALYTPPHHRSHALLYGGHDPGVCCRNFAARVLWLYGFPDQALDRSQEALDLARELDHAFSVAQSLHWAAVLHQLRGEIPAMQKRAEALSRLATAQGFPQWSAQSTILQGWGLAQQGQSTEGITQIIQGLEAHRAAGSEISRPYYLALLADAYGRRSKLEAGLEALAEARTLVDTTEERWWEAELYRLEGELLLAQQGQAHQAQQAETCFHRALDVARHRHATSLELRAAMSLSRLWQHQGKPQAARALLSEAYDGFTEGFDTGDLQAARALLEACG